MTTASFGREPGGGAAEVSSSDVQGWRDELWAAVIGMVDGALRSYYHIVEFTNDPACIFRIGRTAATRALALSDGTEIQVDEIIGTLHFWNEHLPPFSRSGPDIHWAVEMRKRVRRSFAELARFIETDADWREIRAFRGEAALSSRLGEVQLRRVARNYGMERVPVTPSILRQLHEFGECFSAWGLARAYNPTALSRQRFFRRYQELWISRASLVARYDAPAPANYERSPIIGAERLRWQSL